MHEIENDMSSVLTHTYSATGVNDSDRFVEAWESSKSSLSPLKQHFGEYQLRVNQGNENFLYWNIFLHDIFIFTRF